MDGTLTVAAHDFAAMARSLGLPAGRPILESLDELSPLEQVPLRAQLADIEREVARNSRLAPGALELLEELAQRGAKLGILTRNTRANAAITLDAVGLASWFPEACVVGRDEAKPKPSPAGVLYHLHRWEARPDDAVMVGDYLFDLEAGRAAGAATVYVDPEARYPFREHADEAVARLDALLGAGSVPP